MAVHCELERKSQHTYSVQNPVVIKESVCWQFYQGVNKPVWTFEKWRFAPNFVGPCYTNRNFCHPHTLISP